MVPGHTGAQSKEELRRNILDVTMDDVVKNLTGEPAGERGKRSPARATSSSAAASTR